MLVLGLVLNALGIGLFCWLIFELAVYALPFFTAVVAGVMAFQGGAGVVGALFIGIATAGLTLTAGQFAVAISRSMILRAIVTVVFVVPAGIVGYRVIFELSQLGVPSLLWREVLACIGAIFVGGTAWTRITTLVQPSRARETNLSQFS